MSFEVDKPFVREGVEWITLTVVGQVREGWTRREGAVPPTCVCVSACTVHLA